MRWYTEMEDRLPKKERTKRYKKWYLDNVCVLDGECSNVFVIDGVGYPYGIPHMDYEKAEKCSVNYIWMIGICGEVYYGRTGDEFRECIGILNDWANGCTLDIYVQNLPYDFQWMRNYIHFVNVFTRESRKVIRCEVEGTTIRFRDSYILSQMSLDAISNVYGLNEKKLTGTYDYSEIRTQDTVLTDDELAYCEHDCLSLMEYIEIEKRRYQHIYNIPDTQTGRVRRILKENVVKMHSGKECFAIRDWKHKVANMHNSPEVYRLLRKAFIGGSIGVNPRYVNKELHNVYSYDMKSAYIYEMLANEYPCGQFFEIQKDEPMDNDKFCYLIKARFTGIRKRSPIAMLSLCKMEEAEYYSTEFGKISTADSITVWCTDIDFEIIKSAYEYESVEILEKYCAYKDRLPAQVIVTLLQLYYNKEKAAKENGKDSAEYKYAKRLLCSVFGMTVTNYINDPVTYNGEWNKGKPLSDKEIDIRVNDLEFNEMMPYSWGVWVTAYTRKSLWEMILKCGYDVLYIDTDCIKTKKDYSELFSEYNNKISALADDLMRKYNIECGYVYGIGFYVREGCYNKFRYVSAKRYAYEEDGEITVHISGIDGDKVSKFLDGDISKFKTGLRMSAEQCGRKGRFYNDEQSKFWVVDRDGVMYENEQKYGVCIMNMPYVLGGEGDEVNERVSAMRLQ